MRPFRLYQEPIVKWSAGRQHVGYYLEMRLGKCHMAIWKAVDWGCKNILVVAPLSALPDWTDEVEADGQQGFLLDGPVNCRIYKLIADAEHGYRKGPMFFLTNPQGLFVPKGRKILCPECENEPTDNYEIPSMIPIPCHVCKGVGYLPARTKPEPTDIATMPWDCVIWDESYNLANPKSQTNEIAHKCFASVPHRIVLSGEPAPEGAWCFFEQMRWLIGGRWMGRRRLWPWQEDHFNRLQYDWMPKPGALKLIKAAVGCHAYTLTRKDAGIGEQVTREKRWCELPAGIRKAYDKLERDWSLEDFETKFAVVTDNKLAQIAGGSPVDHGDGLQKYSSDHKLKVLRELLTGEYSKSKAVVSFKYSAELCAAADLIRKLEIPFIILEGGLSVEERQKRQSRFRADTWGLGGVAPARIALCQAQAISYGVNLSAADLMIEYSLHPGWNVISQSRARIIDVAKKRPIHYISIICRDTVDEDVVLAAADKQISAKYFASKMASNFAARVRRKLEASNV